jgi:hypothetical protein
MQMTAQRHRFIDDADDIGREIAEGAVVAQAFANFYGITTRADAVSVRRVNLMKGRPSGQVGSIVTTRPHFPGLFDWSMLPQGLSRALVLELIDLLYESGPFGFRGPAAGHIPAHLSSWDGPVRTTQLIAPGYRCPSNRLVDAALAATGDAFLYITSANRSRHQTGAGDEPAHYLADALEREFATEPGLVVLRHRDESTARGRYPLHAPMSTTVLAFHKLGRPDAQGRPSLIVERHGSLHVDDLAAILARHGFGIQLGPAAVKRLSQRDYADAMS